jgi:peptidoglycan/LPS O-acetylase OafA/YrhL
MSFFLIGVAIAQWHFSRNPLAATLCLVTGVLLFVQNLGYLSLLEQPSATAAIFVACGVLIMAGFICLDVPLNWAPLVRIGQASYSLYLVHQNIGLTIIQNLKQFGTSDGVAMATAFVVSVILALSMFHLIEKPMQRLLRRSYEAFFTFNARKSNSAI